jgi:hypothetical protein
VPAGETARLPPGVLGIGGDAFPLQEAGDVGREVVDARVAAFGLPGQRPQADRVERAGVVGARRRGGSIAGGRDGPAQVRVGSSGPAFVRPGARPVSRK